MNELNQDLITKLHSETAMIAWHELQRFFAQGKVLHVSADEDLVIVASYFAEDNSTQVQQLLNQNKVALVNDQQASNWFNAEANLWSVVVAPFVLVQEKSPIEVSK